MRLSFFSTSKFPSAVALFAIAFVSSGLAQTKEPGGKDSSKINSVPQTAVPPKAEKIRMASIFWWGMVVQTGKPLVVWGWAGKKEAISVFLTKQKDPSGTAVSPETPAQLDTVADETGAWQVSFPAIPDADAGSSYALKVSGIVSEGIAFDNILAGDVWLATGQSNMDLWMADCLDFEEIWKNSASKYPKIRYVQLSQNTDSLRTEPITDERELVEDLGRWRDNKDGNFIRNFSAVGFHFARRLQETRNVPVGIIVGSWGGTRIESHMSDESLNASGVPETSYDNNPRNQRTVIYNTHIFPILRYAIKGVLWCQGENNSGDERTSTNYYQQFKAMVEDYRTKWNEPNLPFVTVQLSNYGYGSPGWTILRESQSLARDLGNLGMVVTMDLSNEKVDTSSNAIHYKNKQPAGERAFLWANHFVYGDTGAIFESPFFQSLSVNENKLTVTFSQAGKGLKTLAGGSPNGFQISPNTDGTGFVKASAIIVPPDKVSLTAPGVTAPVAVRYAWDNLPNPPVNLVNSEGLPAAPFRAGETKARNYTSNP